MAWLCGLACLAALWLWPAWASAESLDDERARAHFAAGQEYFAQERYAEAASEFDEAYQLSGRPEMLINRARAEERAGGIDQAIGSLELLFERYPQTSYRAEAEPQLERLRAERGARASEAKPAEPAEGAEGAPGPAEPKRNKLKLWPPRLPTLIVGGALVASVIVSVGTGWAAHRKHERLEARCQPADQCDEDYDFAEDKQSGQRLSRVSTGFTIASLALAAATAVLWVYDIKAQKAQLSLGVRPSLAGADARLRWVY